MSSAVRAACVLLLLLAACGGPKGTESTTDSPLAHAVEHLEEHGFTVTEASPRGDPKPDAVAVAVVKHGTATIYAYGSEGDARLATSRFSAEEQAAPERVRVQREALNVFVGRAPPGGKLPVVEFEDVVLTAGEEH
jgi:hypothetical protein